MTNLSRFSLGPARALNQAIRWAAALVLFALMVLTFCDVMLRNGAARPIYGAFEVTELMLVVLIFAGLPLVSEAREHVTLDLLGGFLAPRVRRLLDVLAQGVCAAALLGAAWLMILRAGRMAAYGDTSAQLKIAYWPFGYFMAALLAATALIHVLQALGPAPPRDVSPASDRPLGGGPAGSVL